MKERGHESLCLVALVALPVEDVQVVQEELVGARGVVQVEAASPAKLEKLQQLLFVLLGGTALDSKKVVPSSAKVCPAKAFALRLARLSSFFFLELAG